MFYGDLRLNFPCPGWKVPTMFSNFCFCLVDLTRFDLAFCAFFWSVLSAILSDRPQRLPAGLVQWFEPNWPRRCEEFGVGSKNDHTQQKSIRFALQFIRWYCFQGNICIYKRVCRLPQGVTVVYNSADINMNIYLFNKLIWISHLG